MGHWNESEGLERQLGESQGDFCNRGAQLLKECIYGLNSPKITIGVLMLDDIIVGSKFLTFDLA